MQVMTGSIEECHAAINQGAFYILESSVGSSKVKNQIGCGITELGTERTFSQVYRRLTLSVPATGAAMWVKLPEFYISNFSAVITQLT